MKEPLAGSLGLSPPQEEGRGAACSWAGGWDSPSAGCRLGHMALSHIQAPFDKQVSP